MVIATRQSNLGPGSSPVANFLNRQYAQRQAQLKATTI